MLRSRVRSFLSLDAEPKRGSVDGAVRVGVDSRGLASKRNYQDWFDERIDRVGVDERLGKEYLRHEEVGGR